MRLDELHLTSITKDQRLRFLSSLKYEEMNARRNKVDESFPDTYNWVFDDDTRKPWPSFNNWLKQGSDVYWIQGKAGSGKSTLMKFIIKDKRTKEALEVGTTLKDPVLLSFFFWLSGTPLQRNLHGLLSSLLHQLLEDHAPLTMQLLEKDLGLQRKAHVQDWAVQELSLLFRTVVRQQTESRRLCIFLDGLDEYDRKADFHQLMDLIRDLSKEKNVKVCVSSRPEQHIRHELDSTGFLRLQDLTKADIRKFVSSELEEACHRGRISVDVSAQEKLVISIVEKADGVFLWVRVALKGIFRGLSMHDTFDDLLHRVSRLPADIERLYEDMLQRLGEDWELCRQEAALYFKICLLTSKLIYSEGAHSLLVYSDLSARNSLQDLILPPRPDVDLHELLRQLERTDRRITACCAGMLEINGDVEHGDNEEHSGDEGADEPSRQHTSDILQRVRRYAQRRVSISHRTVRDFLLEKPAGQEVLKCCLESESAIFYGLMNAQLMAFEAKTSPDLNGNLVHSLLLDVSSGREFEPTLSGLRVYELLQRIEQTCSMVWTSCHKSTDGISYQWELFRSVLFIDIDFMGCTLHFGLHEYFEHGLGKIIGKKRHTGKTLSANYKNYLLLCASTGPVKNCQVLESLLEVGADPNATFYLRFEFEIKVTPWLYYSWVTGLIQWPGRIRIFERFLASGADLRGLAVMMYHSKYSSSVWKSIYSSTLNVYPGVVTEENAICLLRYHLDEADEQDSLLLQHPSLVGEPCHQRVLLIQPEGEKQAAKVVSAEDSASLLAMLNDTYKYARKFSSSEKWKRLADMIKEYYDRLEKVDAHEFLSELGYCKDPKDPAVLRGPIERFEDLPDEPDAA
jgi:NACHT domain